MNRLLLCLLTIISIVVVAEAQDIQPKGPFAMNLDYARFRNDSASSFLEVYYSFYAGSIGYSTVGTEYKGAILLMTMIRKKDTGDTLVFQKRKLPITIQDTSASAMRSTFVMLSGFALPNGEYDLKAFAVDSTVRSQRDSISLPLSLKQYSDELTGSDIELCSEIKNAVQSGGMFHKNSLEVVPNPSLVFGVGMHPVVFRYVEIYNIDTTKTYSIKGDIIDPGTHAVLREEKKMKKFGVRDAVDVGLQNVSSIRSGRYQYRVTVSDPLNNVVFQTEKKFYLNNPQIKQAQVATTALKAAELAGLTADELADEFRKVKYLATAQEIKTFSGVTSADARKDFLAKFWTAVESGRSPMLSGISRAEYLHRVQVANQRYRAMSREGWLSDRGRVYILYGEPDEIERHASGQEGLKAYEKWFYYQIESGVEFDFVDRSGFGDYAMVNSTKRGEVQDDQWQRYLQ